MNDLSRENPTVPEPDKQTPIRILAAEDEDAVIELMQIQFIRRGHSITVVPSASQALEELQKAKDGGNEFDLLITDRGLVGPKDGFDLVAEMHEKGLGVNTCVIMLSASAADIRDKNPGNKLVEKGIYALYGKPFLSAIADEMVSAYREWKSQREG